MPTARLIPWLIVLMAGACMAAPSTGRSAGLKVSPHGPASPIGGLAAGHVAATLPNFTILEHAYGEVAWQAEVLKPPERIAQGSLTLADSPGLGADLDPDTLRLRGRRA